MLVIGLGGCSTATPDENATVAQTSSLVSTEASERPTEPISAAPVEVTSSPAPVATPSPASVDFFSLFYVALEDDGVSGPKIGCNDSMVMVQVQVREEGTNVDNQVERSLQQLLEERDTTIGQSGLYNALARSSLTYVSAVVDANADLVTVNLAGQVVSSGVCDDARIVQQLQYTAMVAAGVGSAKILVENVPIEHLLGGHG